MEASVVDAVVRGMPDPNCSPAPALNWDTTPATRGRGHAAGTGRAGRDVRAVALPTSAPRFNRRPRHLADRDHLRPTVAPTDRFFNDPLTAFSDGAVVSVRPPPWLTSPPISQRRGGDLRE